MNKLNAFIAQGDCWRTLKSCGWKYKRRCSRSFDQSTYIFPQYVGVKIRELVASKKGEYYFDNDIEVLNHVRYHIRERIRLESVSSN